MKSVNVLIREDELDLINGAALSESFEEFPKHRFLDETGRYAVVFSYLEGLDESIKHAIFEVERDELLDFNTEYLEDDGDLVGPFVFMSVYDLERSKLLAVRVISGQYASETFILENVDMEITVQVADNSYEYPLDGY